MFSQPTAEQAELELLKEERDQLKSLLEDGDDVEERQRLADDVEALEARITALLEVMGRDDEHDDEDELPETTTLADLFHFGDNDDLGLADKIGKLEMGDFVALFESHANYQVVLSLLGIIAEHASIQPRRVGSSGEELTVFVCGEAPPRCDATSSRWAWRSGRGFSAKVVRSWLEEVALSQGRSLLVYEWDRLCVPESAWQTLTAASRSLEWSANAVKKNPSTPWGFTARWCDDPASQARSGQLLRVLDAIFGEWCTSHSPRCLTPVLPVQQIERGALLFLFVLSAGGRVRGWDISIFAWPQTAARPLLEPLPFDTG